MTAIAGFILINALSEIMYTIRVVRKVQDGYINITNVMETSNFIKIFSVVEVDGIVFNLASYALLNFLDFLAKEKNNFDDCACRIVQGCSLIWLF